MVVRTRVKWRRVLFACLLVLLVLSGFGIIVREAGRKEDARMREALLRQSVDVAAGINPHFLQGLSFTSEDAQRPGFQMTRELLRRYAVHAGIESLYTMALRDGRIVFGPESIPEDHPLASAPGTVYLQPSPRDFDLFHTGEPHVTGPATDEYGTFVSALSPVVDDQNGKVVAVVGIDVEASDWLADVRAAQLRTSGALFMLLLGFGCMAVVLRHGFRASPDAPPRRLRIEPALCGVLLGAFAVSLALHADRTEARTRRTLFRDLAKASLNEGANAFFRLDRQLKQVVTYFESSQDVSREEFGTFIGQLAPDCVATGFFWMPEDGRAVLYAEPESVRDSFEVFDFSAEPRLHKAILAAQETGQSIGSEPPSSDIAGPAGDGIFIFQSVAGPRQRGLAAFLVDPLELLHMTGGAKGVAVRLQALTAAEPRQVASSSDEAEAIFAEAQRRGLLESVPIFRFGQAYVMDFAPDAGWLAAHPRRSGLLVLVAGLLVSALLAVILAFLLNRHADLEWLVSRRTADLNAAGEQLREAQAIARLWRWELDLPTHAFRWFGSAEGLFCDEVAESIIAYSELLDQSPPAGEGRGGGVAPWGFEVCLSTPEGRERWVSVLGRTVSASDGSPLRRVGTIQDVTERKHSESDRNKLRVQLIHAQKMESVGRLAGGVAHDFNNMLGVILGHAELALAEVCLGHPLQENLNAIQTAAQRSAELTRQLLAFARRQPIEPRALDLNETVASLLKMLRRLIGEEIDLVWKPCAAAATVNMDPSQIDQILANLCVNARDAIAGPGTVTVATETVSLDEAACRRSSEMVPGDYVVLSVSDTGCGMDRATVAQIFEPFFTTKPLGRGTGLGLSTVYGIAKQNAGFVKVESSVGKGTTFEVYIPRHHATTVGERPPGSEEVPRAQGETVLLVEDEPPLLAMVSRLLEGLGYRVLSTASSEEAVQIATEQGAEIDLVFSDVVMPEVSGGEVSRRIARVLPSAKFLFMSGYSGGEVAAQGVMSEGVHFIQKPFTRQALARKLREALG